MYIDESGALVFNGFKPCSQSIHPKTSGVIGQLKTRPFENHSALAKRIRKASNFF
jgi:hypothetical protein